MRATLFAAVCVSTALGAARAQHAAVVGRAVLHDGGEPVANAAVSVLPSGAQWLADEDGAFVLRDLSPGEVRLRVRRIGFAPKDTALVVGTNDTVRVRIEMTRLALELPTVVVNGACTDRTPFEDRPPVLAALFDQVTQNAERLRLLARERPFAIETIDIRGIPGRTKIDTDTIVRGPLPVEPYKPAHSIRNFQGRKNAGAVLLARRHRRYGVLEQSLPALRRAGAIRARLGDSRRLRARSLARSAG
jgi:hypothetical protein